ncbi:hypothetical protein MRBLMR1_004551 [Neorhizobium sp. LMR1-1-1.1]
MLIGDPKTFAVESEITEAYPSEAQMALGYFNIHILGKRYGVFQHDASLLGCSFREVTARLERRGEHTAILDGRYDGYAIAEHFLKAHYGEPSNPDLPDAILARHILWAPDGDAAFDDGGHVLQFDVGSKVRLLGCINSQQAPDRFSELWLDGEDFYRVLGAWRDAFFENWHAMRAARGDAVLSTQAANNSRCICFGSPSVAGGETISYSTQNSAFVEIERASSMRMAASEASEYGNLQSILSENACS